MTTLAATEPRARFRDLVAAEWIKLWSLRSTAWAYLISALAVIGFNAGTAYDTYRYWPHQIPGHREDFVRDGIPLAEAFTGNACLILMLATAALGGTAVTAEYATGLIRTTFAAVPARRSVLAAKAVVTATAATAFGALVAVVSFWVTQAILDGRGAGVPIGHPGAVRVIAASALLAPVCALVGLAIGTVVRHTGTTVVASVVVLFLLPFAVRDDRRWAAVLDHTLPLSAWQRLVEVAPGPAARPWPWTVTGAWTVYAVWALAAAALAVTAVHRRDH